jgi:hypothetical protein
MPTERHFNLWFIPEDDDDGPVAFRPMNRQPQVETTGIIDNLSPTRQDSTLQDMFGGNNRPGRREITPATVR